MKKYLSSVFLLLLLLVSCSARRKGEFNVAKRYPAREEKHVVVLTLSYNNEAFAEKNARSVLSQNYGNFTWIYMDDASSDSTFKKVEELAGNAPHVQLIRNEENRGAMANMHAAIETLSPTDIVVILDGDDWFAHDNVLAHLNEYYADEAVWLTYGQHIEYPAYTVGMCQPLKEKFLRPGGYRNAKFLFSHLRTFYAGLFQKIAAEDLKKNGSYLQMGCDVATMLPMLEMAGTHAFFVRELLVVYNMSNPISDAKKNLAMQQDVERHIRSLSAYAPLESIEQEEAEQL